ncbi:Protein T2 [Rhizoclosmatium sp. JEL0117]|nr:Protein T2 [Rhizoclosmatium sp. JEL0117]
MDVGSLPDDMIDPPLLRSPLYSADAMVLLTPFLIDAISGTLPDDADDWNSVTINWIAPITPGSESKDPYYYITHDPSGSKRGYAVLEILTTEETYYHELTIVKEVIQRKLRELNILSDYAMKTIFEGMDELHELHTKMLASMKEVCDDQSWSPTDSKISEVFLENSHKLEKLYVIYIDNRERSEKTIMDCQNKDENFKNFLAQCTKSRETKFTELKELLLKPFQRLTRYPLLLRELNKQTPDTHAEKPIILQAITAMENIAHSVDEKMGQIKSTVLLFQAQRETKDCPATIIANNRKCLLTIDAMDNRAVRNKLFLCNDLIMVTTYEKTGGFGSAYFRPLAAAEGGVGGGAGGSAGNIRPSYKFLRFIDLLDIEDVEDLADDILKIKLRTPGPNSLSTLTSSNGSPLPMVLDFKIDSQAAGNAKNRFTFVQTFQNEIKLARKHAQK